MAILLSRIQDYDNKPFVKGDNFQINATSYLTDDTMLTGTTIVSGGLRVVIVLTFNIYSIGTEFPSIITTRWMVQPTLLSVQLRREIHSCTISPQDTR